MNNTTSHIVIFETVNKDGATIVLTTAPYTSPKDTLKIVGELRETLVPAGQVLTTRIVPIWPNVLDADLGQEVEMTGSVRVIYQHTAKMLP